MGPGPYLGERVEGRSTAALGQGAQPAATRGQQHRMPASQSGRWVPLPSCTRRRNKGGSLLT